MLYFYRNRSGGWKSLFSWKSSPFLWLSTVFLHILSSARGAGTEGHVCSTRIPEAGAGLCVPHDPPPPPAVSSEKRQGSGVDRGGPGKPPRAMGALRGDVPSAALGGTGLPHQRGAHPCPALPPLALSPARFQRSPLCLLVETSPSPPPFTQRSRFGTTLARHTE